MAVTTYAVINPDGSPAGTTTCEGDTCFPALQAGQSKVPLDQASVPPPAPVTAVDPRGHLITPAAASPILPPATPVAAPGPSPVPAALPASSSSTDDTGFVSRQSTYFTPPPQSFGSGYQAQPFANLPAYQNGMQHPAQSGQPLTSGGPFAPQSQDRGDDTRQQVYVPGGAAAGPYETRAAYPPDQPAYGGNASGSGGGGGGGGSLARDMYSRIKGAVEGKLAGMGPGGSSSSSGYTSDAQYRRQGRRMDRASDRYYDQINNPDPQQAHGWARRALGPNHGNYPLMLTHPEQIAYQGLGVEPGDPGFDWMHDLPVADLAFITGGTHGKGLTRRTQPVRVPHVLKGQIDPVKPANKRELDYSKYAGQVRDIYRGLNGQQNVLDMDSLLGDLAHASKNGALRQGIRQQAAYDPSGAFDRARGYFTSIFNATQPDFKASVYNDLADQYFGERNVLRGNPKHLDRLVKQVARRFV